MITTGAVSAPHYLTNGVSPRRHTATDDFADTLRSSGRRCIVHEQQVGAGLLRRGASGSGAMTIAPCAVTRSFLLGANPGPRHIGDWCWCD